MKNSRAEKFKKFSKWGFLGLAEERSARQTTQEPSDPPRLQEIAEKGFHSPYGHKSSASLDNRIYPTVEVHEPKNSFRPLSECFADSFVGAPPKVEALREDYPCKASVNSDTLATQLSAALRDGPSKSAPLNLDYLSGDELLDSGDESLLRMLVLNTLAESERFAVLSPLELKRLNKESEDLQMKIAGSILMRLHASNPTVVEQAQAQLVAAQRKVDQVVLELWNLRHRRWDIQKAQQQHYTAVLALSYRHQQRELQRLRENMQLRLAMRGSALPQDKLAEALDTIQTQQLEMERLKSSEGNGPTELHEKLEASHERIVELEGQITEHLTECSKSRSSDDGLCSQLDSLRGDYQHLLNSLETLYRKLPGCSDDTPFAAEALMTRINELVDENRNLIGRINSLQNTQKEVEVDRQETAHLKAQLEEQRLAARKSPNLTYLTKDSTLLDELAAILKDLGLVAQKVKKVEKSKAALYPAPPASSQERQDHDSASLLLKAQELQAELIQAAASFPKATISSPPPPRTVP
ncbi:hypothetical protein L0F63_003537 [Massospora cicadina]|nr:hypothetical protein L0F63_003537 [Massospora cicadina]